MPAATDFRLYHGNALDVLAELLAGELQRTPPGAAWLDPDTILIPQPSMRRWLQAMLAERYGVAANLRFLAPGEFVGEVLAANLERHEDAATIDPSLLAWRLYAVLRDESSRAHPAIARALDAYLGGAQAESKAWSLASALAEVFAKYQAWRRDWLLAWDRGAFPDDWQAELWRRATRGLSHRAEAIDRFLRNQEAEDAPTPACRPARVFVFACLNVSPDVLRVLTTVARGATLHFYLPTPTRKYWGDLRTIRERLAGDDPEPFDGGENPLLAAWGRAGRDFVATLFSYEVVAPVEIEAYASPNAPLGLLQRLQLDLLERRAPSGAKLAVASIEKERSLQVHACHTRMREVEVLHDQLRAMLEDDPDMEPRHIAVMAPDIDAYAPYIAAVFGGAQGSPRFIPYTVADSAVLASSPVAALLLRLLDLPQSRATSNDVLDLLASPLLLRRFELDDEAVDRLRRWVSSAGARWGFDGEHRARLGSPREDAYTWRFALDRLLLGHAAADDADIAGVAPWPELEGNALRALDALIRLLGILERAGIELGVAQTASDWQTRLVDLLNELLPPALGDASLFRALERVLGELETLRTTIEAAGFAEAIAPEVVRSHLTARLSAPDARQPFLAGGVTFCRMVPMRLIPFRAIALLGLNDGEYPRTDASPALNRLVAALDAPGARRRGDRSVRDDDRFLFLQLLTATDRVLHLSYTAYNALDGSAREPSIVVSELLDVAASYFDDAVAARQRLIVHHPLQPFGKAADDDARRVRFDPAWNDALMTTPAAHPLPAFVSAPLPADADGAPSVEIDYLALRRFFIDPPRIFLRDRLAVRLDRDEAHLPDAEPFAPADALERFIVHRRVFDALLADSVLDETALCRRLQAEAQLPPGAAGTQRLRDIARQARPIVAAVHAAQRGATDTLPFALSLGDVRLAGTLADIDDESAIRVKVGKPSGRDIVRWHLDALVLSALGDARTVLTFGEFEAGDVGPRRIPAHESIAARDALRWLVGVMRDGYSEPLPFRPSAAWAWFEDFAERGNLAHADDAAEKVWRNRSNGGEGTDDATTLALRGAMPFADETATARFRAWTRAVFGALREARVPGSAT
jgi:exodeoxyribonuclease V gamma subunit